MNINEIQSRIETDPDFVNVKRFDYSLAKLLERYEDGVPNKVIAQALCMTEEEAEELFQATLDKVRQMMKIEE